MRTDSVRCEVTELLADQCAHCIGERASQRARERGASAVTADDVRQVSTRPALLPAGVDRRPRVEFRESDWPATIDTSRDHMHVQFAAPAGDDRDQFGPTFPASYPGQCAGCADRIDEGDAIRHSTPHGGYIHEGCEDE